MSEAKALSTGELARFLVLLLAAASLSSFGSSALAADMSIESAQQALQKLGYKPGPVNGTWDAASREALNAFQSASGFDKTSRLSEGLGEALKLAAAGAQRKGMAFDLRIGRTLIGDAGWRVYYAPDGRKTMKLRDGKELHGRWWRQGGTHCEYSFGHKKDVCGDFFTENYVVFFLDGKWTYFDRSGKKEWGIRLVDGKQF